MEAGSQLIAHFVEDLEPAALLETVEALVAGALGSASAVRTSLSVARGASTVVYITFISFREVHQAAVRQMIGKLVERGAKLTYLSGKEGRSGVLQLQADGLPCAVNLLSSVIARLIYVSKKGNISKSNAVACACDRQKSVFTRQGFLACSWQVRGFHGFGGRGNRSSDMLG